MIHSKLALFLTFVFFLTCIAAGQAQQDIENKQTKRSNSQTEISKIIRRLAPQAAGIPNADFLKLARSGTSPDPIQVKSQPLSLIILCHQVMPLPKAVREKREKEFRFSELTPSPNKLVKLLKPREQAACWTALHSEYITDVTCEVTDNTASGTISFDAGLYAGKVHYTAKRSWQKWRIQTFEFPAHGWKFVCGKFDIWQWRDHFGHITKNRKLPKQSVKGKVRHNDQPIRRGVLKFTMYDCPEFQFRTKGNRNGEFMISLPAGKYFVTCFSLDLSKRFRDAETTDLIVDIGNGQTEVNIDIELTPEDEAEITKSKRTYAEKLVAKIKLQLNSTQMTYQLVEDLKELAESAVPESARQDTTAIAESILKLPLENPLSKTLHQIALEGLLKWATVEEQNRLFCDYLKIRSHSPSEEQAEDIYSALIKAGSERGVKLVIRRLSRYANDDSNPAAKALIEGGSSNEPLLIHAAESSTATRERCVIVLKRIGTPKCLPLLDKIEKESPTEDARNQIRKLRKRILEENKLEENKTL